MKLYAIKNLETNEFLTFDGGEIVWSPTEVCCWVASLLPILESYLDDKTEIITLRTEPDRECMWCSGEYEVVGSLVLNQGSSNVSMGADERCFCSHCGKDLRK